MIQIIRLDSQQPLTQYCSSTILQPLFDRCKSPNHLRTQREYKRLRCVDHCVLSLNLLIKLCARNRARMTSSTHKSRTQRLHNCCIFHRNTTSMGVRVYDIHRIDHHKWVRWSSKRLQGFSVSPYVICTLWKSPHPCTINCSPYSMFYVGVQWSWFQICTTLCDSFDSCTARKARAWPWMVVHDIRLHISLYNHVHRSNGTLKRWWTTTHLCCIFHFLLRSCFEVVFCTVLPYIWTEKNRCNRFDVGNRDTSKILFNAGHWKHQYTGSYKVFAK